MPFAPGALLVSGDVGSGKTSLLYGIEMALFGFAEVDAAYLVRHLAEDAEVRLTLEDDAHRYELVRRFTRRTRRGKEVFELDENAFSLDGAKRTYSTTELRQRAIDLLGFPDNPNPRAHSDLWRWAVYVPQERMREVLDQRPEDRLQTVRKALGLEQYRTAADNALDVAQELRRTAAHRDEEAQRLDHWVGERSRWQEAHDARRREIEEARPREAEARDRLGALSAEADRLETERRSLAEEAQEARTLSEELDRVTKRLAELGRTATEREREIRRLHVEAERAPEGTERHETARALEARTQLERDALRVRRESLEAARRALATAEAEFAAAGRAERAQEEEVARAKEERRDAEAQLDTLAREGPLHEPPSPTPRSLADLDRAIAEAQTELERAQTSAARVEVELAETEELLAAGVCPRCHQAVARGEFAGHRDEFARELSRRRAEGERRSAERDRLREERAARERFERSRERFLQVEERRGQARKALAALVERERLATASLGERQRARAAALARLESRTGEASGFPEVDTALAAAEREVDRVSKEIRATLAEVERARAALDRANLLEAEAQRNAREVKEAEARRVELTVRRSAIALRLPRAEQVSRRLEEIGASRTRLALEVEEQAKQIVRLESQAEDASRRLEEADRGIAERGRVVGLALHHRALALWLAGPFRESVLALERRLLTRAQDEFDHSFARYFATLIEDPTLVARCDAAFTPQVEIDGEFTPPEALSGGERTALALAYRLALGQVVRAAGRLRLDTIILDEPTDGFSPEQVSRMGELLEEIGLPQVVLVSHEGGLASVADRIVRVRKERGISTATPDERGRADATTGPADGPTEVASPLAPRRRRARTPRLDAPEGDLPTPGTPGPPPRST